MTEVDMKHMWKGGRGSFDVALFSDPLLKGPCIVLLNLQDYTICDSWNTYHVIKTVQVDPFIPNLHFELPKETTIYSL